MKEERRKPLYFPTNCPDANDFVAGFGTKELCISIIALIVAIIVGIIIHVNTGNMIYTLSTGAVIVVVTVLLVKRNKYQESFIDQLKQVISYHKAQKRFTYEYYNIYEGKSNGKE